MDDFRQQLIDEVKMKNIDNKIIEAMYVISKYNHEADCAKHRGDAAKFCITTCHFDTIDMAILDPMDKLFLELWTAHVKDAEIKKNLSMIQIMDYCTWSADEFKILKDWLRRLKRYEDELLGSKALHPQRGRETVNGQFDAATAKIESENKRLVE